MSVFKGIDELSHAAAELVVDRIVKAVDDRGSCGLVLAGGSTPRTLYELLASTYRSQMPWAHMRIFWGDERFVPHDDERSNFRMAQESLLQHVPVPRSMVHPIPTEGDPSFAAARYEDLLNAYSRQRQEGPLFDVVLLGLGEDAHTASIFPETMDDLSDPTRRVVAVEAPPRYELRKRISLTLNALSDSQDAVFLVAGSSKQHAVKQVRDIRNPALPASHISPAGSVHWFVDEEADG